MDAARQNIFWQIAFDRRGLPTCAEKLDPPPVDRAIALRTM